jgi:hypothetical protein
LIFPFSESTEKLSIQLNQLSGSANMMMNGPNPMRQLVLEVKQYFDEKLAFVKGQPITTLD